MAKTALITGASDRIGKALALSLADRGYEIFIHYNTAENKALETQQIIRDKGLKCAVIQADFSYGKQTSALIESAIQEGPLDLLINNASRYIKSDITTRGTDLLDNLMKSNFKAPYILTKQYARFHKTGHIINILDTKVRQNYTKHLDYVLTKKLLREFTLLSATQLAPGIRVNGIAPGIILPPPGKSDAFTTKLAKEIPLARSGSPEEIIKALYFLIDSDFTTGEIIYVDGGESL